MGEDFERLEGYVRAGMLLSRIVKGSMAGYIGEETIAQGGLVND